MKTVFEGEAERVEEIGLDVARDFVAERFSSIVERLSDEMGREAPSGGEARDVVGLADQGVRPMRVLMRDREREESRLHHGQRSNGVRKADFRSCDCLRRRSNRRAPYPSAQGTGCAMVAARLCGPDRLPRYGDQIWPRARRSAGDPDATCRRREAADRDPRSRLRGAGPRRDDRLGTARSGIWRKASPREGSLCCVTTSAPGSIRNPLRR